MEATKKIYLDGSNNSDNEWGVYKMNIMGDDTFDIVLMLAQEEIRLKKADDIMPLPLRCLIAGSWIVNKTPQDQKI